MTLIIIMGVFNSLAYMAPIFRKDFIGTVSVIKQPSCGVVVLVAALVVVVVVVA